MVEVDVHHRWVQRFKEGYFARITLIDRWLGTILDMLAQTGQLENTYIIFTSDHGEMLGDHRWFSKTVPYEGSTHIPLIICGPGLAMDTQTDIAVNTWDTAATILDLAGIIPEGHPMTGESLLDLNAAQAERIVISHQFEEH